MGKVADVMRNIFNSDNKKILSHEAHGEPCHVCKKQMETRQGITRVGSGELMHKKCWSKFFEKRIEELKKKHGDSNG